MDLLLAVGSQPRTDACGSGPIMFDISDPSKPTRLGCNAEDGYTHDVSRTEALRPWLWGMTNRPTQAQCLVYKGPDKKYLGRDICYGYNEDTLTIYDVTDPKKSTVISVTSYEGATYTHQVCQSAPSRSSKLTVFQGWVLDPEWQEFIILDDELDELQSNGLAADGYPVTYIWQLTSLESPKQTGLYKGTVKAVDHNQYIKGKLHHDSSHEFVLTRVQMVSFTRAATRLVSAFTTFLRFPRILPVTAFARYVTEPH